MDNVTTDTLDEARDMIESTGANLFHFTPYSPDLSPIEYGVYLNKDHL